MSYTTNESEDFSIPLPIAQSARSIAQQFASQQPTPQKAEQVRLNTLAVCVVNEYLQMMGVTTDLEAGDSWNPIVRLCADVADLVVTGLGRLECRPVKCEQTYHIPPEVWEDRIGMVVVRIDESLRSAAVLGYTPMVAVEELPVSLLQPPEDLLDRLYQNVEISDEASLQSLPTAPPVAVTKPLVNLSRWFQGAFETGWQMLEAVLTPSSPNLAFRFRGANRSIATAPDSLDTGIVRAKLLDLGMLLAGSPVALIVELKPESEQKRDILLQVHPAGDQPHLPPSLQLTVLDESGLIFLEAQARNADDYIQLEFTGLPGEQFSVKVALGDASVQEDFTI